MSGTLHFQSKQAYRKYLAYGHIHGVFTERVRPKIVIAGKVHHVEHCEICKQKNHHTHEHHLYHPKHHRSKHHSGHGNGIGKTTIHSVGIKLPRVNL